MSEIVTMADVQDMLDEVCNPLIEQITTLLKMMKKERARLGYHATTGVDWLDDMLSAEHGTNGR